MNKYIYINCNALFIRRERNRMHAKKTRDRKKELLEISEVVIIKMEKESFLLREYLGMNI